MIRVCLVVGLVFMLLACGLVVDGYALGVSVPPDENTWVEMMSMQQARSNLGAAVVEGKIYAIGGVVKGGAVSSYHRYSGHGGEEVGTNEVYDPVVNSWVYRASMPIPGSNFAVVVFEDKIYCIGGGVSWFLNSSGSKWDAVLSEGFNLVYDPVLDVWEYRAAMPVSREGAQAHVVGGKIYVLGGSPNGSLNWVYDPLADSWMQRASMPDGFVGYSSAVYGGRIYVVGVYAEPSYWANGGLATNGLIGFNGELLTPKIPPMVQVYDPEKDVWSVVAIGDNLFYSEWPVFLLSTSGVYAPSELYLLYNPYGSQFSTIYYLVMFDWESNNWDYKDVGLNAGNNAVLYGGAFEYLPSQREGFAVVVLDDLVYVVGGYTIGFTYVLGVPQYRITTASALVERYTPFGYGKVAPVVSVLSLEDGGEYAFGDVPLVLGLNRSVSWLGYSLDGQANVTVKGNVTLSGLSSGLHSVRVFAEDEYGNMGASETITFTVVNAPLSLFFIGTVVTIVVVAAAVVVCGGLLFLRKRRSRKSL